MMRMDLRRLKKVRRKLPRNLWRKCGVNAELVFVTVNDNKFIKTHEMVAITGLSQRTVENAISRLKKAEFLKREGSAKGGHWEILGDDKRG